MQGSLDGIVTQQPHPPAFSTAGLLDYIIQLIVEEDEVSTCYAPLQYHCNTKPPDLFRHFS